MIELVTINGTTATPEDLKALLENLENGGAKLKQVLTSETVVEIETE